jgi:hypothetical protein
MIGFLCYMGLKNSVAFLRCYHSRNGICMVSTYYEKYDGVDGLLQGDSSEKIQYLQRK